ncbi:MAG TPA: pyridoxal phosphate-dependent aminotransferase [Planctomycetota bacterium]|nr:pyridoxal phosphate-dependent aminotransferase [Planctomycetota bacterium]
MAYFPYMTFARTRAHSARHSLTQSGMPTPADPSLALPHPTPAIDASYAGASVLPELEARIATRLGIDPRRVIASLGATGGMHLAAWRFFGPGSRVASETPSYEPLRSLPRAFGAETVLVERDPADGWRLDPARVRAALSGAARGHVFLTNSHNPTGALLTAPEIALLAEEAARAKGVLVACEVYLEFAEAKDRPHAALVAQNGISISSLTKAYGLGGLRVGWIVLGEALVEERESLLDLAYLTYVDLPTPALQGGVAALERLEDFRGPLERVRRESRPIFLRWLAETPEVVSTEPALGLTAFPRVVGVSDTRALARHLLERWDVGVVPGEYFGRPGHLRVGFALEPERLPTALERLREGIRDFRG